MRILLIYWPRLRIKISNNIGRRRILSRIINKLYKSTIGSIPNRKILLILLRKVVVTSRVFKTIYLYNINLLRLKMTIYCHRSEGVISIPMIQLAARYQYKIKGAWWVSIGASPRDVGKSLYSIINHLFCIMCAIVLPRLSICSFQVKEHNLY
jgi:hypothetical protein